jgi:putative heme iron utilization protein
VQSKAQSVKQNLLVLSRRLSANIKKDFATNYANYAKTTGQINSKEENKLRENNKETTFLFAVFASGQFLCRLFLFTSLVAFFA